MGRWNGELFSVPPKHQKRNPSPSGSSACGQIFGVRLSLCLPRNKDNTDAMGLPDDPSKAPIM